MKLVLSILTFALALPAAQYTINAVDGPVAGNAVSVPFLVSGPGCAPGGYSTPATLNWEPGSQCAITFPPHAPHAASYFVVESWGAAGPGILSVKADAAGGSFTAVVARMFRFTVVINPMQGGTPYCDGKPGTECYAQASPNVKTFVSALPAPGWTCDAERGAIAVAPQDFTLHCRQQ